MSEPPTEDLDGNVDRRSSWTAPARPPWLTALNDEGKHLDMKTVVPLDKDSLIEAACLNAGLSDFGEDHWRTPFEALCRDIDGPAELTLMGRLMTRSDLLIWLTNRLQIRALLKEHPEIRDQEIESPMFIVGLPRSGTSILFELLSLDPACGVPETWEAMFPCPPPTAETYDSDPRIARAHKLSTQWNRVVPEFATMHEMGGRIPAECGLIMANSFISDHVASLHQAPEYSGLYYAADMRPAYADHKTILQILQWKNPRQHWLLKAPAHQNHLATLLETYPDARIIQTHRDPIKCMASTTSLMGCLYYMRSDLPFDSDAFEDIIKGEPTAQRLEFVMSQRKSGVIPKDRMCDSRFQDLMDDPIGCVRKIYDHFEMTLSEDAQIRMAEYLANKPKDKFGVHKYSVDDNELSERAFFRKYQKAYRVPNEI